ncbi:hypothetical protein GYA13_03885 [Candidatus Kuenenbacteria bacterium]|nr:hypothetical protein [Candidatus Kuenenbacteria bacterium]
MFIKNNIKIIQPKPYEEIGGSFVVEGLIPKSWLNTGFGMDDRVFLDFIDMDGLVFTTANAQVISDKSWLSKFRIRSHFYNVVQFNQFNVPFITRSQGRINIKLSGHKEGCQLFVPIIVKNSNPNFKPNPEIIKKHGKVGEMILQYEHDLNIYNKKLEEIQQRRLQKGGLTEDEESRYRYGTNWEITGSILDILEKSGNSFNGGYPFAAEDLEEKELEEKYKDALKWRGPLLTGLVGKMNGYEFRVYSDDHGKHFHVIHKDKRINARFSFPEIKLINYKNIRNSISNKTKNQIIVYFKQPENFKKLEGEFQKKVKYL